MDLASVVGIFNITIGVLLVLSICLMTGGLILWYVRLGTFPSYRTDTIKIMEWAISILFVIDVILFVAQFVQSHMQLAMMIVGLAVAAVVVYFVASEFLAPAPPKEDH